MEFVMEKMGDFMGACDDYNGSSLVIAGAPMDFTVSFRPGTREGPSEIRNVSEGLEEYSPELDLDLSGFKYFDAGNISLPFGSVNKSMKYIGEFVEDVLLNKKIPLLLGGEHLISLPAIEKAAKYYPDLAVIQLDAHADLREDYLGEKYSHATVIRRVSEIINGKNIFQLGIRSGTREEFQWAHKNTNIFVHKILEPLYNIIYELKDRPVYLTIDIDVVDPAFAPGTGTPEPGGCSSADLFGALYNLKEINLVGMDVVEVSPIFDQSQRTALLAAKLVREAILLYGKKK